MLCLLCRDFLPVTRDDGAGGLEVRGFVARQPLLLLPAALGPEPEPEAAADAAVAAEALSEEEELWDEEMMARAEAEMRHTLLHANGSGVHHA